MQLQQGVFAVVAPQQQRRHLHAPFLDDLVVPSVHELPQGVVRRPVAHFSVQVQVAVQDDPRRRAEDGRGRVAEDDRAALDVEAVGVELDLRRRVLVEDQRAADGDEVHERGGLVQVDGPIVPYGD